MQGIFISLNTLSISLHSLPDCMFAEKLDVILIFAPL